MAISLVAVGQKWTATIANLIIAAINSVASNAVTPTSVAGAGVSLSGTKVVAAAAATINVNGCFTSTYDWYRIEFDLTTSTAENITLRLRLAGADANTAYDRQSITGTSATATTGQGLNSSAMALSQTSLAARQTGTVKMYGPALATATAATVQSITTPNPMTTSAGLYLGGIQHRTTTAYDGFSIVIGTGTLNGTIRIYGMN